jgi:hypothetical protein
MSDQRIATKHYAYRLDHDTGFAPHVSGALCTLCGCKTTTIEVWASPGSWVVGIGGKGTGKPDDLIYLMKVESDPTVAEFRRRSPVLAAYLRDHEIDDIETKKILVSRCFYYFGNHAIHIPPGLRRLIIGAQGCKRVAEAEISRLVAHLSALGYAPGVHGTPNNPEPRRPGKCGCLRVNAKPRRAKRPQRPF